MRNTPIALVLASLLAAPCAQAEWISATHVGFAVQRESSTGFDGVTGSVLFLDVARRLAEGALDVGFRTVAQGGEGGTGTYYRLGAGPLASWNISDSWTLQMSAAVFDESAMDPDGANTYRSRGRSATFGWERVIRVGKRLELAWGGFVSGHRGAVEVAPASGTAAAAVMPAVNEGFSHGVEAALRFIL